MTGLEKDPLVGTRLSDRYDILSVIGRGGMGVVYKGRHETMDRMVAIKMLHAHLVSDTEAIKRFHREAKAVSRVKHPHTVALYDFGITATGQPYIVMDFIDGYSLKRVIKEEGALSLTRVEHIFQQVVDALACAHDEGIVHRDLKPENIMLSRRSDSEEWVEIVDFGISKLKSKETQQTYNITRVGDVCGSPPYMSPEQCLGTSLPIDHRSDIYSLGIVVYESLAGRLPFKAKTAIEMIDCHLYAPPAPLKVSNPDLACCEALNSMLAKALHKEPDQRQQSMKQFGAELHDAIKRDSIKLSSLRNRVSVSGSREALLGESLDSSPGQSDIQYADSEIAKTAKTTLQSVPAAGGDSFIARLGKTLFSIVGRRPSSPTASGYALVQCPFCLASMDPQIKFCLDCGRNVASPQDLAKLRSIQQVFTIPKVHAVDRVQPEFSKKAKRVMANSGGVFGIPRAILVINLVLLLALCGMYYMHERDIKSSSCATQAQSQARSKPILAKKPHHTIKHHH